jgi:hypothetical protein
MGKQLDDIYKGVASATGSELLGNIAADIVAGVGGPMGTRINSSFLCRLHLEPTFMARLHMHTVEQRRLRLALVLPAAKRSVLYLGTMQRKLAERVNEELKMAAGGGPSLDQWTKMSKQERRRYWTFMAVLAAVALTAVAYALLMH